MYWILVLLMCCCSQDLICACYKNCLFFPSAAASEPLMGCALFSTWWMENIKAKSFLIREPTTHAFAPWDESRHFSIGFVPNSEMGNWNCNILFSLCGAEYRKQFRFGNVKCHLSGEIFSHFQCQWGGISFPATRACTMQPTAPGRSFRSLQNTGFHHPSNILLLDSLLASWTLNPTRQRKSFHATGGLDLQTLFLISR